MSETVKLRTFCNEPMGEKPISAVPGVGPIVVKKLKAMGYHKAKDLYLQLRKLDFNEQKLRVWAQLHCKGAKVATIFKALKSWHLQYGTRQDLDDGDEASSDDVFTPRRATPQARLIGRGSRTPLSATQRIRNSVQFDLSNTERPTQQTLSQSSPANHIPQSNNALSLFFASFADSCNNILPEFHTELKMDILGIVRDYEKRSREKQSQPSASQVTNGV